MAIEATWTRPILYVTLLLVVACDNGRDNDFITIVDFDEVDDMTIATADAVDWQSGMVFATNDPFEDPFFYDDPFYDDPFYDGPFYLTLSGEAPAGDPERAAELAAGAENMYFSPEGCASVQRVNAALRYALAGCAGPLGKQLIDNTMLVTFSDVDGDIGFGLESAALRVDGRDVAFTGRGTYRSSDGSKSVQYASEQRLSTPFGELGGSFESQIDWSAGSNCVTRNASGRISSGGLTWEVDVDDYERCAGRCPASGSVTVRNGDDASVLTFDGTDVATLERAGGGTGDVELDCER